VLCVISIGVTGYRDVYGHNHPLQLVLVERVLNPQSYPNDPLADTSVAYASLFWYLVAYASKVLDIAYVLAILFIVSKVLLIYAAFQVGRALFPQYVLAAVACAVLIATPSYLYSPGNLAQGNTEQTVFAVAFLFLSLSALVRRKWWKWESTWALQRHVRAELLRRCVACDEAWARDIWGLVFSVGAAVLMWQWAGGGSAVCVSIAAADAPASDTGDRLVVLRYKLRGCRRSCVVHPISYG